MVILSQDGPVNTVPDSGLSFRVYKYALQAFARYLLPKERVSLCLRSIAPKWVVDDNGKKCLIYPQFVIVKVHRDTSKARYGNLLVCSRIWQCPICAYTISDFKRKRISSVINSSGAFPVLVTLTVRHHAYTSLKALLDGLLKAFGKLSKGSPYKRFTSKYGLLGYVRALEVTWGASNGWHPHIHIVFLFTSQLDAGQLDDLHTWFTDRWLAKLQEFGFDGDEEIAVDVRTGRADVDEYLAKFGRLPVSQDWTLEKELVSGHYKTARGDERFTPFGLLDAFGFGENAQAGALFVEYAKTFKGRKQIQASNGFWRLGGLDDLPDDEVISEQLDNDPLQEVFMAIDLQQWRWIAKHELRGKLLDVVQENVGSVGAVLTWLYGQGMPEVRYE